MEDQEHEDVRMNTQEERQKHGSPSDRGSADAWYGRRPEPHWWPQGTYHGEKITEDQMTEEQIRDYWSAYENEDGRKDWGQ